MYYFSHPYDFHSNLFHIIIVHLLDFDASTTDLLYFKPNKGTPDVYVIRHSMGPFVNKALLCTALSTRLLHVLRSTHIQLSLSISDPRGPEPCG